MAAKKEVDAISGVETTGHEWDGLKELNHPLPRWWLWTFYICIIFSVIYWVLMPSWPLLSDYTRGMRGHSQRALVGEEVAALQAARAEKGTALVDAELDAINSNPDLLQFAMANGRAAFGDNCAGCHGTGATGFVGFPNLNDDEWIWGGTLDQIRQTILYGVRSGNDDAHTGDMLAFGRDGVLDAAQVRDVASFVLSMSGGKGAEGADLANGQVVFEENCVACHGDAGAGNQELGAPNLTDNIWLYGGSIETVMETIQNGRGGVMPAWVDRLDEATIKSLAVYVHSLGGGQ
ncbi:MAG: cytochrome-c oxidase, cbb3-type subunit III [Rhodobiaceae bacterium]|nr:cytochrome-c oxidase, cbb3-type subunit III [Rhodobiaceae bacterium]MCC0040556.1 cytochrome-c oxidase, cbb3-type subunit III [Rhodobiaceae bacterium]MCC0054029.1 cytochrome-c oxidase, cbb3-type subunit III [Rhodobiaceae bacterium]